MDEAGWDILGGVMGVEVLRDQEGAQGLTATGEGFRWGLCRQQRMVASWRTERETDDQKGRLPGM